MLSSVMDLCNGIQKSMALAGDSNPHTIKDRGNNNMVKLLGMDAD